MPIARRLPMLIIGAALIAGACASGSPPSASPTPSASTGSTPTPSTAPGAIEHLTGPADVVLRYEEGGGGMMLEWTLAQAPIFTLYGDGTVIFRDPARQAPADAGGRLVYDPLRTAKLSAEQMQSLLAFAISEGGLAVARDRYDNPMIADAGNATFTINAGGRTKQVTVYALSESDTSAPDQGSRAQFLALAQRLRNFDENGKVPTAEYVPTAWQVSLIEGGAPLQMHPWPWPELTPKDFVAGAQEPTLPGFPHRVMTADEIALLDLGELKGGLMGYYVEGPDDKPYSVVVRPLLPDEES